MLAPAVIAVAHADLDVDVAQAPEALAGLERELLDDVDAVDLLDELGENRRLVADPGADFEHRVPGLRLEQNGHERDDERLRDRLATDRQGRLMYE